MRTKTTSKILSETSEETKQKVRNNANNLINKKMETKKMTTSQKAAELVQDLGLNHAIYVTEEVIEILKDWEGTELAQNDWVEIEEIIRNMKKLTFKPYKEQILVQSSIEGEVIWEDKEILKK